MMKFLEKLSSDEMRKISGGYDEQGNPSFCQCRCTNGPGAWTGYYFNWEAVFNALDNYCGGLGSCHCSGSGN